MFRSKRFTWPLLTALAVGNSHAQERPWIKLFNGTDLTGWTPKFAHHPLGANPHQTFRVEEGMLKVSYDQYDHFAGQFGHLYSNLAYSRYILRMEYRFEGKMMPDAPSYVNLNSGVMIHTESPLSMSLAQAFPSSLEFQFLADEGKGQRPTGNVCTPGTLIEIGGKQVAQHIVPSSSPTFPPAEWVKIEVEVHGSEQIIHRVNGKEVLRYQNPQLDPEGKVAPSNQLLAAGAPRLLASGHIALQAEGQGVWFRNIELKPLD